LDVIFSQTSLLPSFPFSAALIDELARVCGRERDVIRIHLGDTADGKGLVGSYICTENPGEFQWRHGALTEAVTQGRWLVIEDIDLAPVDVISMLLPVFESRTLCVTSRGEEVVADPGFRIFTTCTQQHIDLDGKGAKVNEKFSLKNISFFPLFFFFIFIFLFLLHIHFLLSILDNFAHEQKHAIISITSFSSLCPFTYYIGVNFSDHFPFSEYCTFGVTLCPHIPFTPITTTPNTKHPIR
jgi:hypothetical protein